jgi:hypothetical protein
MKVVVRMWDVEISLRYRNRKATVQAPEYPYVFLLQVANENVH